MVVVSILLPEKFEWNDHRQDAPHFISLPKINNEIITHFVVALVERISVLTPDSISEFYFEFDERFSEGYIDVGD